MPVDSPTPPPATPPSEREALEELAKEAVKRGVQLFRDRDWDGTEFTLPGGLLSSIWEKVAERLALEAAETRAAQQERDTLERRLAAVEHHADCTYNDDGSYSCVYGCPVGGYTESVEQERDTLRAALADLLKGYPRLHAKDFEGGYCVECSESWPCAVERARGLTAARAAGEEG